MMRAEGGGPGRVPSALPSRDSKETTQSLRYSFGHLEDAFLWHSDPVFQAKNSSIVRW